VGLKWQISTYPLAFAGAIFRQALKRLLKDTAGQRKELGVLRAPRGLSAFSPAALLRLCCPGLIPHLPCIDLSSVTSPGGLQNYKCKKGKFDPSRDHSRNTSTCCLLEGKKKEKR